MKLIDLHTHSCASDGTLTPTEVVQRAIEKDLAAIALTDHDTIDGVEEAMNAATGTSLELIPGIELSCYYKLPEEDTSGIKEVEIHVLGLFVDYKNPDFTGALDALKEARENRNLKMVQLFQNAGIPMTMEKLQQGNPNSVITRAHFARVLIEEGIVKNKDQAFKKYLGIGCPYYLPKPTVTPEYIIPLIKQAGGIPILAHPLLYKLGYRQVETLLDYLTGLGLQGLEAYHSSNNHYESDRLRSMANAKGLVVSGGSDFHGSNKPDIDLGTGRGNLRITEHILNQIKDIRR